MPHNIDYAEQKLFIYAILCYICQLLPAPIQNSIQTALPMPCLFIDSHPRAYTCMAMYAFAYVKRTTPYGIRLQNSIIINLLTQNSKVTNY